MATDPTKNMNSNSLLISAFLSAIAAIALLPVSGTAAGLAFTATGILTVLFADYGRTLSPVRVPAPILPFHSPGRAALAQAA
jgi:hypothetical protein